MNADAFDIFLFFVFLPNAIDVTSPTPEITNNTKLLSILSPVFGLITIDPSFSTELSEYRIVNLTLFV